MEEKSSFRPFSILGSFTLPCGYFELFIPIFQILKTELKSSIEQEKKIHAALVSNRYKCWKNLANIHRLSLPSQSMRLQAVHSTSHLLSTRNVGGETQAGWIQLPEHNSWFYTFNCPKVLSSSNSLWNREQSEDEQTKTMWRNKGNKQHCMRFFQNNSTASDYVHSGAEGFLQVQISNKSSKGTLSVIFYVI